ncbi:hypothetical protein [Streptomyces hoynatensis]|uniref:Uncharacterized protein n=1 Tax=Streptomyces hoynatensis TaxID=1141874 RepID=A0A3A9Z4Z8_9ACTN|nr:hypothetical protein [Streptomyces hoynatensis]RKN42934.1 hypothetical protein D7294_10395 [Streptomyces hoynatensis]
MRHTMRAEYEHVGASGEEESPGHEVRTWHMVRGDGNVAMCGRVLQPEAETRPDGDWGTWPKLSCHTCGALYLREVA